YVGRAQGAPANAPGTWFPAQREPGSSLSDPPADVAPLEEIEKDLQRLLDVLQFVDREMSSGSSQPRAIDRPKLLDQQSRLAATHRDDGSKSRCQCTRGCWSDDHRGKAREVC